MAAPGARLLTGEGGSPSGAGRAGRLRSMRLAAIPLLGRVRRRGLENPLLPLPAVLAVAVGFFVPLAVLILYSFWPTEMDGSYISGRRATMSGSSRRKPIGGCCF